MVADPSSSPSLSNDLKTAFRQKATYMKDWKPASNPSNRDKLELYALHKQAVAGDAPASLSTSTPGDRAKYSAWKSKSGLSQPEAMRLYVQESDRQVRVYGLLMDKTLSSSNQQAGSATAEQEGDGLLTAGASHNGTAMGAASGTTTPTSSTQPRGLSAIPLLCAAASESRSAYLRRLANTLPHQSWWSRQEALSASSPSSLAALPETLLIKFAALLEYVALQWDMPVLPQAVLQSFLWPLHNVCLALWMGIILVSTLWTALTQVASTLVWGSRRTGLHLAGIWKDTIVFSSSSRSTLVEEHQPLSARLVGLMLLPMSLIVGVASRLPVVWGSSLYVAALLVTWWYWFMVLPWLAACMIGTAVVAGNCFALIELAGV